ncbi:HD domain-containing phosphohydrolase [Thalassolituus maritimus]|uniref:Two-component system response regulator n=1 Tax=Thalassolituus maritimus TaxID=484498 RepID=A0ABP9ZXX7_9GAMM
MSELAAFDFDSGATVLLVDDEPMVLSSLRRLLEDDGSLQVYTVESAIEALTLLEEQSVDLIISDMKMPGMDGATFLTQAAERWPDTDRVLLTGYSDVSSAIQAINEGKISQYLSKPWDDEDLLERVNTILSNRNLKRDNERLMAIRDAQNQKLQELTEKQEQIIRSRTEELQQTADQLDMAYEELKESYFQCVPLLAALVDLNEKAKKGHAKRVAEISDLISAQMDLSVSDQRLIHVSALVHDIGKIGLDQATQRKSIADMTRGELLLYKQHPLLGESALMAFEPIQQAAHIVRSHHERYDGGGFPDKITGEAIPLGARVVAVANDYDNLLLPNNFTGAAMSDQEAYNYIVKESGKRYDPEVVTAFDYVYDKILEIHAKNMQITLPVSKLNPGMVLSGDLINHHGIVMLVSGRTLTESLIDKLKQFEVAFDTKLQVPVVCH